MPGCAVIGERAGVAGVSQQTSGRWQALQLLTWPATEPVLLAWLQQHGSRAVMLRPDRYIMGLAQASGDLDRLSNLLPQRSAQTV